MRRRDQIIIALALALLLTGLIWVIESRHNSIDQILARPLCLDRLIEMKLDPLHLKELSFLSGCAKNLVVQSEEK